MDMRVCQNYKNYQHFSGTSLPQGQNDEKFVLKDLYRTVKNHEL